jgi:hypothetical protein
MAYNTPLKNIPLRASKAPNLPIAPVEYSQLYIDQLSNVLRLYFAQVDNFTQAAVIPDSGTTANRPLNTGNPKLEIGQYYFDTTIGRPIWWNGTNWINASGTVV